MNSKWGQLNLLIHALQKLDPHNGERQNVVAFIQSCYCGLTRDYDLEWASSSLAQLTEQEQHVFIQHIVRGG